MITKDRMRRSINKVGNKTLQIYHRLLGKIIMKIPEKKSLLYLIMMIGIR